MPSHPACAPVSIRTDAPARPIVRTAAPLRPPRISTERLLGGRREIVLQHGLEEYRLRVTAAGKLILTK